MRTFALCLLASGCSLLYDGNDLHGKASKRPMWMSASYPASDKGATDLALGDVDGDSNLDVVQIESEDNSLLIFLGHGDGTFSAKISAFTGCVGPTAVTLTDLDTDGKADVVVVCYDDNSDPAVSSAAKLLATSNGQFLPAAKFNPSGDQPVSVASTDVNQDGNRDVLIVNQSSGNLAVLRGAGQGNLAMAQTFATSTNAYGIAVGDLDKDGVPDVVVSNLGDDAAVGPSFSVLLAQGGTLNPNGNFPAHDQPYSLTIGDFDGKNGADVAVAGFGLAQLDIALNQGGGSFLASLPTPIIVPYNPGRIQTADLDGDGHLDLVLGAFAVPEIMILYGKGDGTFETPIVIDTATPGGLQVADVDKDGKPDIVIAGDDMPGTLTVLLSR